MLIFIASTIILSSPLLTYSSPLNAPSTLLSLPPLNTNTTSLSARASDSIIINTCIQLAWAHPTDALYFDWSYCPIGPSTDPRTFRISCSQYTHSSGFYRYPLRIPTSRVIRRGLCPEDYLCVNGVQTFPHGVADTHDSITPVATAYCVKKQGAAVMTSLGKPGSTVPKDILSSFHFPAGNGHKGAVEAVVTDLQVGSTASGGGGGNGDGTEEVVAHIEVHAQTSDKLVGGVVESWRDVAGGTSACENCTRAGIVDVPQGVERIDVKVTLGEGFVGGDLWLMSVFS